MAAMTLFMCVMLPLNAKGASPKIVASYVKTYNGNTSIMIDYGDGKLIPDSELPYMTYVSVNGKQNYYERMAKNGTKSYQLVVTLGDSSATFTPPVWKEVASNGTNVYDWDQLDKRVKNIIDSCPDAKIMLQIFTGAPRKWLNENDDASVVTTGSDDPFRYNSTTIAKASQRYPSLLSKKYREQCSKAITDVVAYTKEKYGANILGYILSGAATEEWYHHAWHNTSFDDFNPDVINAFKDYALKTYGDIAGVRSAWGKDGNFKDSDIVLPPAELRYGSRKQTFYRPGTGTYVADFYRFYNEIIPDTIGYFANVVKAVDPNKVVGCFYGYQLEFSSDPGSGHNALGRLLKEKNVDFIKLASGSLNRYSGTGGDNIRGPIMSAQLNNKVVMNDNDSGTSMLGDPSVDCFSQERGSDLDKRKAEMSKIIGYTETPELSSELLERVVMFASANGFQTTYFDLHGGYYANPIIEKAALDIEKQYKTAFESDRSSAAQILLVVDEKSCDYVQRQGINGNSFLASNSQGIVTNMMKIGAPYDVILADDLDKAETSRYKLIWFLNSYYVSASQKAKIEKLKGGNRTVVWSYAPGIIDEKGFNISNSSALTGITLKLSGEYTANHLAIKKGNDELSKLIYSEQRFSDDFVENDGNMSEQVVIDDKNATIFGYSFVNEKPTAAYKNLNGWKSVVIPNSNISAASMRAIAKYAGVHLYAEPSVNEEFSEINYDTLYANKSILSVHANGDGKRTIKLSEKKDVYDLLSQKLLFKNSDTLSFDMKNGTTESFMLKSAGTAKQDESVAPMSSAASDSNLTNTSGVSTDSAISAESNEDKETPVNKKSNKTFFYVAIGIIILIGAEAGAAIYILGKRKRKNKTEVETNE